MKRTSLLWCCCAVLLLAACNGDGGDGGNGGNGGNPDSGTPDAGVDPTPTTITVSGKVLGSNGKPLSNAAVLVLGKQPVTTDASGAFSVPGVTTPYDIVAVNGGKQSAIVYKGVTRQSLTLSLSTDTTATSLNATLAGTIVGAQTPSATVREPQVVFVSPEGGSSSTTFNAASSTYSANVTWSGSATTTGTIFAFQGERASSSSTVYTRFTGFGRRDNVSLSSGAAVSNQSVSLGSVANSTLAGTITPPSGFTLLSNNVNLEFPQGVNVSLFNATSPGSSFSYAVPVIAQSTLSLTTIALAPGFVSISAATRRGMAAGTNNVSLTLKDPSNPTLPLDDATNVTRTSEFTWSGTPGGVHIVAFLKDPSAGGTPYTLNVITSAARTTIPDLSALGMAVPANTAFSWQVQTLSPISSVDTMLAGSEGSPGVPAEQNEIYITASGRRDFTTASTP